MLTSDRIRPQMQVVCSDDALVAFVEQIYGRCLRLSEDAEGKRHYIPLSWVRTVDDKVHLDRTGAQATASWSTHPL